MGTYRQRQLTIPVKQLLSNDQTNINMELNQFCQSCSMPLANDSLLGTEKDGSKSRQYCKFCYQDGAFINPEMTLEGMTTFVKAKMLDMNMDPGTIEKAVKRLPYLNRWMRLKSRV
jgi:hypothetical protein